ncbi:hypothetical protein ACFL9T_01130 [Thermodesulfobacteriota bacterium]
MSRVLTRCDHNEMDQLIIDLEKAAVHRKQVIEASKNKQSLKENAKLKTVNKRIHDLLGKYFHG